MQFFVVVQCNQWILCADHELDYSLDALDHLIDSITIFEQEVLHLNFSTKLEIPALVMMGDMIKMSILTEYGRLINLRHRAEHLKSLNLDVLNTVFITDPSPRSSRDKRALLPMFGTALKWLFGTETEQDLQDLNNEIELNHDSNKKIIHILDRQATLVKDLDVELKSFENLTLGLKDHAKQVSDYLSYLSKKLNILENVENAGNVGSYAIATLFETRGHILRYDSILQELFRNYENMILGLQQLSTKKLSSFFLPPAKLMEILSDISTQLPTDLEISIPLGSSHLYSYYSDIQVTATSFKDKLRIFINIPLKSKNRQFKLFKFIPWPSALENNSSFVHSLDSDYHYLALSSDEMKFIHLTPEEAKECMAGIKLCIPSSPVLQYPMRSCLYALLKNKDTSICRSKVAHISSPLFQKLEPPNTWLFYTLTPRSFNIQCIPDSVTSKVQVFEITLHDSGILKLPGNCSAHSEGIELPINYRASSSVHLENDLNIKLPKRSGLPTLSVKQSLDKIKLFSEVVPKLSTSDIKPLKNIGLSLDLLQNDIRFEEIRLNSRSKLNFVLAATYSQWGLWGLHLIILILLVLYMCKPKCSCSNCFRRKRLIAVPQHDPVELEDMNKVNSPNAPPTPQMRNIHLN